MSKFVVIAAFWFLIFSANSSVAKEWHGIVPLRSTREDVRKRLGIPNRQYEIFDDYDLEGYSVSVLYATDNCEGPLRYWWGTYRVSPGTVLSITVEFDEFIPSSKFKIPNLPRLKKGDPDHTLTVDYFDAERGIQYSVQDKKVSEVEYGPSATDASLRCVPRNR